jgi:hypothetical protein
MQSPAVFRKCRTSDRSRQTHVEKLHVRIRIALLVPGNEIFQKILAVWRVDQESGVVGVRAAGKEKGRHNYDEKKEP